MGPLQRLGRLGTQAGIVFMRLLAPLPLPWVRFLGVCLGYVLYAVVLPRRRVVHTNLALCFPALSLTERGKTKRQIGLHHTPARQHHSVKNIAQADAQTSHPRQRQGRQEPHKNNTSMRAQAG